jgi:enoyl-CoA hydratase/carnithine racemase
VKDGVTAVRMNRSEKKYAITKAVYMQLANALTLASADSAVRLVAIADRGLTNRWKRFLSA